MSHRVKACTVMNEIPPERGQDLPQRYESATGKGDILIPGAGTVGMVVLIVSLSMLFAASMFAFGLIRYRTQPWPPLGMPEIPQTLWLSTVVILLASVAIQYAMNSVRRDSECGLKRGLWLTMFLGGVFLAIQGYNWWEFVSGLPSYYHIQGAYLGMFYVLTGLHALHVIGGMIPLGIVIWRAHRGRYSRNFHPGVRYSAVYWHFLDVVWVVLFVMIYF